MTIVMCNNKSDHLMSDIFEVENLEMDFDDDRFDAFDSSSGAWGGDNTFSEQSREKDKDDLEISIQFNPPNNHVLPFVREGFKDADFDDDLELPDYFDDASFPRGAHAQDALPLDQKNRKTTTMLSLAQNSNQQSSKSLTIHRHASAEELLGPDYQLMRSQSEDWTSYSSSPKQRRVKWSDDDITNLWRGIQLNGNNWREVQKYLPKRTYHQVKDKGRRLLQQEYWRTGRSKNDADGACEYAKSIAEKVLKR